MGENILTIINRMFDEMVMKLPYEAKAIPNILIMGHDELCEYERQVFDNSVAVGRDSRKRITEYPYRGMKVIPACQKNCLIVAWRPE